MRISKPNHVLEKIFLNVIKVFFCPIGPLQHEKISRVTESTLSLKQLTADKVKYIEEKKKRKKLHRFVYWGFVFLQRLV